MRATVVIASHPLCGRRDLTRVELRRPLRVRRLVPAGPQPVIALLNGRPLLRAGWRRRLRDGDHLAVVRLPAGGGGGNSNPLRVLLSILLIAVTGPVGTFLSGLGWSAAQVAIGKLAVMLGGQYLINALIPPPKPEEPGRAYTLQAQGNLARLDQAIPVQYGRLKVFPDFAAEPYVENAGNEQFLFQLHCLGAGEYDVESITIGDTPLTSFAEIATEIVPPGGQVTLFPAAVESSDVVSGQELPAAILNVDWSRGGATVTMEEEEHDRASGQVVRLTFTSGSNRPADGVYTIGTVPDGDSWTVTAADSATGTGKVEVRSIVGGEAGFPACEAGQTAAQIGVDLILPRGLHGLSGSDKTRKSLSVTWEARPIADDDTPIGDWTTLGTETLEDKTSTPILKSWVYSVTPGRWAVRGWREDKRATNDGAAHDAQWAGLRGYLTAAQDWPPVTLLALRMRATGNLSLQASRRIAVTLTRKLPVWDGDAWSAPQATRSIAWALADCARNTDYGPGLEDWQVDLDALLALDALWAARGDHLDLRVDSATTWWEAATTIARVGRARPFLQGGMLRVVRDGPETLPVALFCERNILRGSFRREWLITSPATAHSVEVQYLDALTWRPGRVRATYPGYEGRHTTVRLDGVTSRAHALREAWYMAASNRHRRAFLSFETEAEGFLVSPGDLIAVQHDVIGAGVPVEVTGWDADNLTLTVTPPVTFGAGAHVIGLSRPDGSVAGPIAATAGAAATRIVLAEPPDFAPETAGQDRERTRGAFGAAETWAALAKVVSVEPIDEWRVRLAAVVEDDAVHTAEDGQVATPRVVGALPRAPVAPAVTDLRATVASDGMAYASWRGEPGATAYQVEVAEGGSSTGTADTWLRVADTAATQITLRLPYGPRSRVRVRALGLTAGPWASVQVGVAQPSVWTVMTDPSLVVLWSRRSTGVAWDALTDTMWESLTEEVDAT